MSKCRIRAPWAALAAAVLAFALATPLLGAAPWQGKQIESGVPIDVTKARAELVLEVEPTAFTFDPVIVTVDDKPKSAKKVIGIRIRLKNNSDRDYYVYATATLLDADGKPIVSKSKTKKADDYDHAKIGLEFRLPSADAERVKRCKLQFAFEKE